MPTNTRKIAVVIPKYGLIGGAEGFAAELTERIGQNNRYEIHVFANQWRNHSSRIIFHKIPIVSFPKFLTTVSFAFFAGLQISKMNFDLIHTHDRIFNADLFTMHGIPHRTWITNVRGKNMSLFDRATDWVEKCLVQNQRCKKFLTVSSLAKEKFLQEYRQIGPDRVQIIHPGVDVQRFERLTRKDCREKVRGHLRIGLKDFVILFVSMNFEIKGLAELMAGVAKFKSKYRINNFKLLITGKGNVKKFWRLAHDLGIQEQALFLGIVPKEKLERIYLASDVFAMLSKFDTFGIAVLEAMAASLPGLISKNVGAKDIVREEENGFIFSLPTSPEEIADRIGYLLDDGIRSKMAKESYITAGCQSWEIVAQKVQNIYDEIIWGKK